MREIKFIFEGLGAGNCYQADIEIYDLNGLIYSGRTYNREINICLDKFKAYLLIARINGNYISRIFLIDDKTNYYYFSFINNRKNTFHLTDANYYNLPIEKGEILLCQN